MSLLTKEENDNLTIQDSEQIEKLLHELARGANRKVDEARRMVTGIADKLNIQFWQALAISIEIMRMPNKERDRLYYDMQRLHDKADRVGLSMAEYVEKIAGFNIPKPPTKH